MKYLAFDGKTEDISFSINEEQQIIAGPSMVADMPLMQIINKQKIYVIFPKETIKRSVQRMASMNLFNSVDFEHSGVKSDGINLYEMFIINRSRGIVPPKGFENLTEGSLWQGYHIPDKKKFDFIKQQFNGFSIQGVYDLNPQEEEEESEVKYIINEMLDSINGVKNF